MAREIKLSGFLLTIIRTRTNVKIRYRIIKEQNMNSEKFFYDFGRALYRVDSFYDEFAKQSNVSSALLWVLYALNDGNPHTQIDISNDWELPQIRLLL